MWWIWLLLELLIRAASVESSHTSVLTHVEDWELGHHWNFIYISITPSEGPHLSVLGLEAGLPQAFEVDSVNSDQTGLLRIQHVCFDQAGDVTWNKYATVHHQGLKKKQSISSLLYDRWSHNAASNKDMTINSAKMDCVTVLGVNAKASFNEFPPCCTNTI